MSSSIQKEIVFATAIMLTIDALDVIEKSENDLLEYEAVLLRNLENNLPITRASKVRRPKTMGFWTDIFPNLMMTTFIIILKATFAL
jgi:hypothetical protein